VHRLFYTGAQLPYRRNFVVSSRAESKPVPKFRKKENRCCGVGGGCVCGWLQAGCRGAAVGGTRRGFGCRVVGVFCIQYLSDGRTLQQGKVGLVWTPPKGFLATFFSSPATYFPFLFPGAGLGRTGFSITNLSWLCQSGVWWDLLG